MKRTSSYNIITRHPIADLDRVRKMWKELKAASNGDIKEVRVVYRGPRISYRNFTYKANATHFDVYVWTGVGVCRQTGRAWKSPY